jgi:hypothetical protein
MEKQPSRPDLQPWSGALAGSCQRRGSHPAILTAHVAHLTMTNSVCFFGRVSCRGDFFGHILSRLQPIWHGCCCMCETASHRWGVTHSSNHHVACNTPKRDVPVKENDLARLASCHDDPMDFYHHYVAASRWRGELGDPKP